MDFSGMRYDISKIPADKAVVDAYPALAEYPEFKDRKKDQLVRIALYATDEKSPFVQNERDDYERRITKIFEYLKIKDRVLMQDIVNCIHRDFENMVSRYFIMADNLSYQVWSDKFRMFHYIGLALRQPPDFENMTADMNKRATLSRQRDDIFKELVGLEEQIFTDTFTRRTLKEQVAKMLQLPEKYAQEKSAI